MSASFASQPAGWPTPMAQWWAGPAFDQASTKARGSTSDAHLCGACRTTPVDPLHAPHYQGAGAVNSYQPEPIS
jgi:hypothetical protein